MSFSKAIKNKKASATSQPAVDIRKLISGEPVFDDNSVLELDTDQVINKKQVRTEFDEHYIEELGRSMMEVGQIQPIVVSPVDANGLYEIRKGECRWRAARLKGLKIRAIVDARTAGEMDAVLGELAENIQRDDLKPLEIAEAIKSLKGSGLKQGDIARRLGKNDAYVSRHLKLLTMPECVSALYASGVVRDVPTLNNLIRLHKIDPDWTQKCCRKATDHGLSRKESEQFLQRAKASDFAHFAHVQNEGAKAAQKNLPYRDGKVGMFNIEVRLKDGRTGILCLDRQDADGAYFWVNIIAGQDGKDRNAAKGAKKERVSASQLVIIRSLNRQ